MARHRPKSGRFKFHDALVKCNLCGKFMTRRARLCDDCARIQREANKDAFVSDRRKEEGHES